jgi:hypothetical protein
MGPVFERFSQYSTAITLYSPFSFYNGVLIDSSMLVLFVRLGLNFQMGFGWVLTFVTDLFILRDLLNCHSKSEIFNS